MRPRFEYGEAVRVIRNVRNDGTYPGEPTGRLLVRRGSVGYVRDVGTFLQDQIVYSVDFIDSQCMVGCREPELQLASDPWVPTRFEFRDKVTPRMPLAIQGEVIARPGDSGEVEKVLREQENGPAYHVRFSGRTLQVPECALDLLQGEPEEA
ncbi:nitrogen fixation protein NifZ [Sedimenticola hydrogenitrophicus]|uniref:nitrogen fixation protein NifZ n=1 Tax=Sedimenticola hydrogenitrophicus TaxID=2967975 RepID=UPI0023B03656|nr:nitrogen fixation protein NifZ [Sedimenticola hydrogenitrophicus]